MDFSWVRQLADESNSRELEKQEHERDRMENECLQSLATVPLVEKLFKLIQICSDEFNRHCMFPELRVLISRTITKKSKGSLDSVHAAMEEYAFFSFARRNSMYGIRGLNGVIEFVDDIQVSDVASSLNLRLDEMTVQVVYKLIARAEADPSDKTSKHVVWTLNDETLDGPMIITLCQQYFSRFIKGTDD